MSEPSGNSEVDSGQPAKRKALWKRLWPVALLLAGLGLAISMGWHRYLSFDTLAEHREFLQNWVIGNAVLAPVIFMLIYMTATAFSVPGGIFLTIGGGFLFGSLLGTGFVVVGATMGAFVVFIAARTALGDLLRARAGPFLQKMEAGFRDSELSYLLVLRLIPIFPFWLVNIVPAFLGVSTRNYLLGTFLGIIPGAFVYASVGASLGGLLDDYDPNQPPDVLGAILEPRNIVPIVGLIVLSLLPVAYKRFKARKAA